MQWTVLVEAKAPGAVQRDGCDLTRQQTAAWSRVLAVQGGEASGEARHWSGRVVVVEAEPVSPVHTAAQAAIYGQKLVLDAASQVGLPDWPVVRVEVVPELLGAQEAAAALGVSRQRFPRLWLWRLDLAPPGLVVLAPTRGDVCGTGRGARRRGGRVRGSRARRCRAGRRGRSGRWSW